MKKRDSLHTYIIDPLVGLGIGTAWMIFKIMPLKWASKTAGFLGGLIYPFMRQRNRVALYNLTVAFPDKTTAEKKQIIKKMWIHFAKFFAEMPHSKEWVMGAEIAGGDFLQAMKDDEKGGFVCSAHFGNWEFASSYTAQHYFQLHPVYRPANNPWIEKIMFKQRRGTLIPKGKGGARILVNVLKKGEHVAILCDQRLTEGISVPFFGRPAMTPSAMVVLAIKMKLPIVMGKAVRMPDGHFAMSVKPLPISENPDFDQAVYETVLNMNKTLEEWIRQTPEQWMWIHRRFDKKDYK